jgi:hypothetical protein
MNDTSPLAQTCAVLLFLLACLSLNAQHTGCFGVTNEATVTDSFPKGAVSPEQNLYVVTPEWSVTIPLNGVQFSPIYFAEPKPLKWYDFSTYKFKGGGKRAVWIGYAVAGILHGGREAYHAQPNVFEKRFNAAPLSFWGSEQWKRQYFDRDPEIQAHKPNAFNGFRDYWHFSGASTKYILIGGAFTIGASEQPTKYKIIDTLIAFAGFSVSASLTYTLLR